MSSIQATRLRKGMLIQFEGMLCRILDVVHLTPGNKRGQMKCRMRDIKSGRLVDHRFRSEDTVERAVLDEVEVQFLYRSGDEFHFMDISTYAQLQLTADDLGEQALYLLPEAVIRLEMFDGLPVGVELPNTVELKVADTVPGIRGATASAQVKPATMETGLVVTVPAFISSGDKIRIDTETGDYVSRV